MSSKMDGSKMYKAGESDWFYFWNDRVKSPVVAEFRVDWKGLDKISHLTASFEAKVVLFVRVAYEDIYYGGLERSSVPQQPHRVIAGDKAIAEWEPWLEFPGKLSNKWTWVREEFVTGNRNKPSHIIFGYEIQGEFDAGNDSQPRLYPFDYHVLELSITSNWDKEKIIFVPWGEKESWAKMDLYEDILQNPRDRQGNPRKGIEECNEDFARVRFDELSKTMSKNWVVMKTPRLVFTAAEGFKPKNKPAHVYSEVDVSLYARRKPALFVLYEAMRPFCLAGLASVSLFLDAEIFSRIVFNTSILIAMSVAFTNASSAEKLTVAELYKVLMFMSASSAVLFMVIPLFNCRGVDECVSDKLDTLAWIQVATVAALHLFVVFLLFLAWPSRRTVKNRFTRTRTSSDESKRLIVSVDPDPEDDERK